MLYVIILYDTYGNTDNITQTRIRTEDKYWPYQSTAKTIDA